MRPLIAIALVLASVGTAAAQSETLGDAEFANAESELADAGSDLANAESDLTAPLPAPPASANFPTPQGYDTSSWAVAPGGPEGVVDPVLISEGNRDFTLGGGLLFAISYTFAASLSIFFGTDVFGCGWWGGCNGELAALGLIPLAPWAAGFSGSSSNFAAYIVGGVMAPVELIGLILFLVGVAERHPRLVPRDMVPGQVSARDGRLTISF